MTTQIISKLIEKGARRWTKGDHDRLYIDSSILGLSVERYKSGNISYAEFHGEKISNSRAAELADVTIWIDLHTGEVHAKGYKTSAMNTMKAAAEELIETIESEIAAEEAAVEGGKLEYINADDRFEQSIRLPVIGAYPDDRVFRVSYTIDGTELERTDIFGNRRMVDGSVSSAKAAIVDLFNSIYAVDPASIRIRSIEPGHSRYPLLDSYFVPDDVALYAPGDFSVQQNAADCLAAHEED